MREMNVLREDRNQTPLWDRDLLSGTTIGAQSNYHGTFCHVHGDEGAVVDEGFGVCDRAHGRLQKRPDPLRLQRVR